MTGRRRWATLALVIALVAVVAVVTVVATSGGGGSRSTAELVVALPEDQSTVMPPSQATVATGVGNANAPVFETLVALAPDFSVQPLLATSWELVRPDTWRFHLRSGVTFHDGQPFDADAVAYNANELWDVDEENVFGFGPNPAVVVDDHTVDLTTMAPNLRLVEQLVHPENGIQAPGTYAGDGGSDASTPTGTGPFVFSKYRPGLDLVVKRFEGYWGPRKAQSEAIRFRFIPDAVTRAAALRTGDVDAVYDFPRGEAGGEHPKFTTVTSDVATYDYLLLNHRAPPDGKGPEDHPILTTDVNLRRAVGLAIDRQTIVDTVWNGTAVVTATLLEGVGAARGYPYDPARAEALLDAAGWRRGGDGVRSKDGRRFELTLVVADPEAQGGVAELIQDDLKAVGISVEAKVLDGQAYYEELLNGRGDMFAEIAGPIDGDVLSMGAPFTAVAGGYADDYAPLFGAGDAFDALFTEAVQTPDTALTRKLAGQALDLVVDDVVAVVPLAGIRTVWGLAADVRGFAPHPAAAHQKWAEVSIAKAA